MSRNSRGRGTRQPLRETTTRIVIVAALNPYRRRIPSFSLCPRPAYLLSTFSVSTLSSLSASRPPSITQNLQLTSSQAPTLLTMSNILHGAQSVIFLYLSCAPCYDAKRRWTQKRVSKGDRAAKAQFVEEQPGLYHHPSPMQTNPYWAEEIERGPNFEKGGKKVRRESRERELVSAGESEGCATAMRGGRGEESIAPSSATVAGDSGSQLDTPDDATWNHKLYQREDEGLWGVDIKVTLKAGQRSVRHALNSGELPSPCLYPLTVYLDSTFLPPALWPQLTSSQPAQACAQPYMTSPLASPPSPSPTTPPPHPPH